MLRTCQVLRSDLRRYRHLETFCGASHGRSSGNPLHWAQRLSAARDMKRIFPILEVLVALTIVGCAHDQVRDLGGGTHSITACSDGGITNPQVTALRAADKYCAKFGQSAAVRKLDSKSCPDSAMSSAISAEFTCR